MKYGRKSFYEGGSLWFSLFGFKCNCRFGCFYNI